MPPVQTTLTLINYDLRINGDMATGQANLTIEVIKSGWVRVPIPWRPQPVRYRSFRRRSPRLPVSAQITANEASLNVVNLQRRVAGVLPIRVDVSHAGNSYSFVRLLVLDEETKVSFRYKSKQA